MKPTYTKSIIRSIRSTSSEGILRSLPERLVHLFSCDYAVASLHAVGITDTRLFTAIEAKRLWLEGKVTSEELSVAFNAANDMYEELLELEATTGDIHDSFIRAAAWAAARSASEPLSLVIDVFKSGVMPGAWREKRLLYLATLWDLFGDDTPRRVRVGDLPLEIQE